MPLLVQVLSRIKACPLVECVASHWGLCMFVCFQSKDSPANDGKQKQPANFRAAWTFPFILCSYWQVSVLSTGFQFTAFFFFFFQSWIAVYRGNSWPWSYNQESRKLGDSREIREDWQVWLSKSENMQMFVIICSLFSITVCHAMRQLLKLQPQQLLFWPCRVYLESYHW